MSKDAFTPITTSTRLSQPLNGTLYTTTREVAAEKPAPALGSTMKDELGPRWEDSILVYTGYAPNTNKKALTLIHARIPSMDDQLASNFEDQNGNGLTRTFIIPRPFYLDRAAYEATIPVVGSADAVFSDYVFAFESLTRLPEPLGSYFVAVVRQYLEPQISETEYDQTLKRNVITTRKIIPVETGVGSVVAGKLVEIQHGSIFHDIEVTRQIEGFGVVTYPITLPSIPVDVPYRFPPRLNAVNIYTAAAYAASTGRRSAFDEAITFDFDLTDPAAGPYEGTQLRFITTNPDSLRASYPIMKFQTRREAIYMARAWFYASSVYGNEAQASGSMLEIPASIHGDITIALNNPTVPSAGGGSTLSRKMSLVATPNYSTIAAASSAVVGYDTSELPLGLYLVTVTRISLTDLYS